jgi:hypothetical protein
MKFWALTVSVLLAYAAVIFFAITFRPPVVTVGESLEEVRAYITDCDKRGGSFNGYKVLDEYHMECDLGD